MIRPQSCPICDKVLPLDAAASSNDFPFCSERCRNVDLLRWSDGRYAIVEPLDPDAIDPDAIDPDAIDPDVDPLDE